MRQEDLVADVSNKTGLVRSDVRLVITAANETLAEYLNKGEEVCLTGIGRIRPTIKKGRMGRNPKTGEPLMIPDKIKLQFTLAKSLKASVEKLLKKD
jgi:DNA-binding protein HU-beta